MSESNIIRVLVGEFPEGIQKSDNSMETGSKRAREICEWRRPVNGCHQDY